MNFTLTENRNCVLVVTALIATAIVVHVLSCSYMGNKSAQKMKLFWSADSIFDESIKKIAVSKATDNMQVLKNQYNVCHFIKKYYIDLGKTYFNNYYTFSICSVLFGTFLTIATFLVINAGWQNSSLILKTFFLTNALIASFYFLLPNVLDNKQNLDTNLNKMKLFQKTQYKILFFVSSSFKSNEDSLYTLLKNNYEDINNNFDLLTVNINSDKIQDPAEELKLIKPEVRTDSHQNSTNHIPSRTHLR